MFKRDFRWLLAAMIVVGSYSQILNAQVWDDGGADDLWTNPLNWSTNSVPVNGFVADVVIDSPAPTILNTNVGLNSVAVGPNGVLNFNPGLNMDFFGGTAATTLTNMGTITTANNTDMQLSRVVDNSGLISVVSAGSAADLEVASDGATLTGGGTIALTNNFNSRIMGLANPLLTIEDQTIEGWGQLGANSVSFDNQGNLIHANSTGNELWLDPNADGMINTGILQASGGGILRMEAANYDNTGGTIRAQAGSEIQFGSISILQGDLITEGDGLLRQLAGTNVFYEDLNIDANIFVENNTDFGITGTINNTGTITMNSVGSATDIEVQTSGATLIGSGTIFLTNNFNSRINGVGNPLLTIADQTIEGFGQIGANSISIDNQGNMIHANSPGNELRIDPNADGMTNTGILQASGGAVLRLEPAVYDNTDGTVRAQAGSEVQLNSLSMLRGDLISEADGLFRQLAGTNVFYEDLTIDADVFVENNTDFGITGTINNTGTITMNSTGSSTDIEVQPTGATLTGGGLILLQGDFNVGINGVGSSLLTIEDQTIEGFGQIGKNTISIDNQGNMIHANSPGNELRFDPNADGMINTGVIQASDAAVIRFEAGEYDNTGGTIRVLAGSEAQFPGGVVMLGGTLITSGNGLMQQLPGTNIFFQDLTMDTDFVTENNSDFGITGTINNLGTITMNSTGSATDIEVQAENAVLTGSGTTRLPTINSRINGPGDLEMNDGRLEGIGQVMLDATFRQQATIAPGNSIGEMSFGGNFETQIVDGASIEIEIGAATGLPGIDWDFLNSSGTLDFDDEVLPSGVTIKLNSLDENGDPGLLADFDEDLGYSFVIATAQNITGFSPGDFTIDTSGFANSFSGEFSVTVGSSGSNEALILKYGEFKLGDINGDGSVNLLDVDPFIQALAGGGYIAAADINCDGVVNLLDVSGFINLLAG